MRSQCLPTRQAQRRLQTQEHCQLSPRKRRPIQRGRQKTCAEVDLAAPNSTRRCSIAGPVTLTRRNLKAVRLRLSVVVRLCEGSPQLGQSTEQICTVDVSADTLTVAAWHGSTRLQEVLSTTRLSKARSAPYAHSNACSGASGSGACKRFRHDDEAEARGQNRLDTLHCCRCARFLCLRLLLHRHWAHGVASMYFMSYVLELAAATCMCVRLACFVLQVAALQRQACL